MKVSGLAIISSVLYAHVVISLVWYMIFTKLYRLHMWGLLVQTSLVNTLVHDTVQVTHM